MKFLLVCAALCLINSLCAADSQKDIDMTKQKENINCATSDIQVSFIGHASLMIENNGTVQHIVPWSKIFYDAKLPKADVILVTHEHFDHCWGVNYLLETFPAKVVSTRLCAEWVQTPFNYFNQLYYNSDEIYRIEHVDIHVEDIGCRLMWCETPILFVKTPGHTDKGMCVEIGGCLFTGDTVLFRTKPFLKKKYGASKEELKQSIEHIYLTYPVETKVFPGHGEPFALGKTEEYYKQYFNTK